MSNPNKSLPPLNPLLARSTLAAALTIVGLIGPLIGGGLGEIAAEIVANEESIQDGAETAVNAINALLGLAGGVWFWIERRAPNNRLSFRKE
ncbi:hypothetical protein AN189_07180 [Loktanella sp. 3ANDIMAR09]|nr:hypothetical protein AN189_07180 [Loktanella sp. 3ANDIMAR09]